MKVWGFKPGALATTVLLASALCLPNRSAAADEVTILRSFTSPSDGYGLNGLAQGPDGKLYGATTNLGDSSEVDFPSGTLYRLNPDGTDLEAFHTFSSEQGRGSSTPLVLGHDGLFYGATSTCFYRIEASLTVTVLHCENKSVGRELVVGDDGNFYGTMQVGGDYSAGSVFRLTPDGEFTTLYSFTAGADGVNPLSGLSDGGDGYFYGATSGGGSGGGGTVFRVDRDGKLQTLYSFKGQGDGTSPTGVLKASDGNLYGSTNTNPGTLFKLSTSGTFTTLHTFGFSDGSSPVGRPTQAPSGALYGQTFYGGSYSAGTLYRLGLDGSFESIHDFTYSGGQFPGPAPLALADDGNLYGTTVGGGNPYPYGVVFTIKLDQVPPPAAPAGLTAVAGDAEVRLTWGATEGASSYTVFQSTAPGDSAAATAASGLSETSVTLSGLSNGTTYYFSVAAVNAGGTGDRSAEISATPLAVPAAPTGLVATAGNAQVALSWSPSAGASTYSVYRGTSANALSLVASGVTGTSYVSTGLSNGTPYFFDVVASNSSGSSAHSAQVSATPEGSSSGSSGGGAFSWGVLAALLALAPLRRSLRVTTAKP